MSQASSREYIAKVISQSDIVTLVSAIRPDGVHNHNGKITTCCPNHVDTKFSAVISPQKQMYHCRETSCGASGNVFDFFMANFPGQDIETIINDIGGHLEIDGIAEPVVDNDPLTNLPLASQALVEVQTRAAAFYQASLKKSPAAMEYVKKRGLTDEIIQEMGIGYAPADWRALRTAMPDYDNEAFVNSGLVIESDNGDRYDRFRDRIMFPIKNADGLIIAFGGRILDKSDPKYLNSPETPVFSKNQELYGLFEARDAIHEAGYALITEGYMDVVSLRQFGLNNCVGTLGTASGEVHIEKLLRDTRIPIYGFDGDAAGRKAAWRAAEHALAYAQDGVEFRFLFFPPEHDPDSFIRANGKEAVDEMVRQSITLNEFLESELSKRYNLTTMTQKSEMLIEASGLLRQMPTGTARTILTERVAAMAGISIDGLMEITGYQAIPGESDSFSSSNSPAGG